MNQPSTPGPAGLVNLLSERLGARALWASDDFFAEVGCVVRDAPAHFDPTTYTPQGKEMDGWESRRKRTPGHDRAVLKLAVPGRLRLLDIDTSHFLGNQPAFGLVEACCLPGDPDVDALLAAEWTAIVEQTPLRPGCQNLAPVTQEGPWTHVRLHMFPAGGIARLRGWGLPAQSDVASGTRIDLVGMLHGGRAVACSDMFFSPMDNLIRPDRPDNMGQGWETRRRRGLPGEDWIVLAMGHAGVVDELEVDTAFFKGNYPNTCAVDALCWPGAQASSVVVSPYWAPLLSAQPLGPDAVHRFAVEGGGVVTHLRLRIQPDGGVARLRAWGTVRAPEGVALSGDDRAALTACCGSKRWVDRMMAARPFVSPAHISGEAERLWWLLDRQDWIEAFSHHPRIGEDVDALRQRWSAEEQSGISGASEETLAGLAEGNRRYAEKFGYLFLVCASGKTADEMLALLRRRLGADPAAEIFTAAGEHAKITQLRLNRLWEQA